MKKTIFLTVYDGHISKSIILTNVIKGLKEEFEIVAFVPASKKDYYKEHYSDIFLGVEAFPNPNFPRLENWFSQMCINSIHADNIRIRIEFNYRSGSHGILRKWARLMLWQLGRFKWWRTLLRFAYGAIPDTSYEKYFDTYKPAGVFTPNMISHEDLRLLKTARKRHIPSVGMMKSWDNITSKAFVAVKPDFFIAQNQTLEREMQEYVDFPRNNITVSGFPQFDIYHNPDIYESREEFCKKMGLNPKKKFILYCGAGIMIAPDDIDVIKPLMQALAEGKLSQPTQVLFRLHPKYPSLEETLSQDPNLVVDRPGKNNKEGLFHWEFELEDVKHLANSLKHCDVLICTASTMNIEAAIFDKPSVNPAFDGNKQLPYAISVLRRYDYDHQKNINRTGGIKIAYNFEEMLQLINESLEHPEIGAAGRARIREEQCYRLDGQAGIRIAEVVRSKISRVEHNNS